MLTSQFVTELKWVIKWLVFLSFFLLMTIFPSWLVRETSHRKWEPTLPCFVTKKEWAILHDAMKKDFKARREIWAQFKEAIPRLQLPSRCCASWTLSNLVLTSLTNVPKNDAKITGKFLILFPAQQKPPCHKIRCLVM